MGILEYPLDATLVWGIRTVKLYSRLKAYRNAIGAPWFDDPWDLNLFIIRSGQIGEWDDLVVMACVDDAGRLIIHRVRATGDAWEGEWTDPSHSGGCVYVLDGHYPRGLVLGEHRGRPALRQNTPFNNVRWPPHEDHAPTVVELEGLAESGASFSGILGTHLHNRLNGRAPERPVANDSEGCTVSLYYHQHIGMIELVDQQRRFLGSGIVSPTFMKRSALS